MNAIAAMTAATPPPTKAMSVALLPLEHIAEEGNEHDDHDRLRHDHLEVLQLAHLEPSRQRRFAVEKERGKPERDDVEDRAQQE